METVQKYTRVHVTQSLEWAIFNLQELVFSKDNFHPVTGGVDSSRLLSPLQRLLKGKVDEGTVLHVVGILRQEVCLIKCTGSEHNWIISLIQISLFRKRRDFKVRSVKSLKQVQSRLEQTQSASDCFPSSVTDFSVPQNC